MHHAQYIEGPQSAFEDIKAALKPFVARRYERFGIDEARELVAQASLKHESQTFLLGIESITTEAQQALLKLFEEPQEGTNFVLLVPHGVLLPTLRSRMLEYAPDLASQKVLGSPSLSAQPDHFVQQGRAFIKMGGKERSDYIAALLKDEDNTKERVREFVDSLERALHPKIGEPKVREALADIAMVRDYLRDRSPSLKMLLEHLALSLPQT